MMDCPSGGERDLALAYLAGRLPEGEAQAFEAHYFGCATCWQDVQAASELREVFDKPAVAPAAFPARPARTWLPLAAAATIAVAALGVWQLGRRAEVAPARPVVRSGATQALEVRVEAASRGRLELAWPAHPDAATYVVHVLSSDGIGLGKAEVREPRLDLDPAVLPAPAPGATLLVQVEALDAMRQVVASSEPSPLPKP